MVAKISIYYTDPADSVNAAIKKTFCLPEGIYNSFNE